MYEVNPNSVLANHQQGWGLRTREDELNDMISELLSTPGKTDMTTSGGTYGYYGPTRSGIPSNENLQLAHALMAQLDDMHKQKDEEEKRAIEMSVLQRPSTKGNDNSMKMEGKKIPLPEVGPDITPRDAARAGLQYPFQFIKQPAPVMPPSSANNTDIKQATEVLKAMTAAKAKLAKLKEKKRMTMAKNAASRVGKTYINPDAEAADRAVVAASNATTDRQIQELEMFIKQLQPLFDRFSGGVPNPSGVSPGTGASRNGSADYVWDGKSLIPNMTPSH